MFFRRHKGLWQALLLFIIIGVTFRFSYNYYKENEMKLKAANIRLHELLEDKNKMSRDLNGAMESKNSLEYTLRSKTQEFAKKKEEWTKERRDLENRMNKHKASFDALDLEHRMLKAKHNDLQVDYHHMKKNFDRLKDDHTKVDSEHRKNYEELKNKNERIILALQKQVEHHQKQENSLLIKVKGLEHNVRQYQTVVAQQRQELSQLKAANEKNEKSQVLVEKNKVRVDQTAPKRAESVHSKLKKRRSAEKFNPKLDTMKKNKTVGGLEGIKVQKHKKFLQTLQKWVGEPAGQDNKEKINKINAPGAGKLAVDTQVEDGKEKHDQVKDSKDVDETNVEVISENGKDTNFKIDEQLTAEDKKEKVQAEDNMANEKADERLNNDQKFDDQDVALQEGDENDEADDEEEENVDDEPDKLLVKNKQELQDEEETDN